MSTLLLTVEQAADALSLHSKTVQRYIREGKLAATRVGKSYRIPRAELEAFAGINAGSSATEPTVRVTCITEITDLSISRAERIATFLQSAALTGDANSPALQIQTAFDQSSGVLKIVTIGHPADVSRHLELLQLRLESLT